MKKRPIKTGLRSSWILTVLAAVVFLGCGGSSVPRSQQTVERPPRIDPDYSGIVVPPNIAPLNFAVRERGIRYHVRIRSRNGKPIDLGGADPAIRIPMGQWKRVLRENRGEDLFFDVEVETGSGTWERYGSVSNRISADSINGHVVYRLLEPQFKYWNHMGIYQRNLDTFDERCILHNEMTGHNCMNCHAFCNNDPDRMVFHLRTGAAAGTLLMRGGTVTKINTSTPFNKPGAYPSWHPDGKVIAFSVNQLTQFFHGRGEIRDVLDWASDLILYHIASNTVSAHPKIASLSRLETFPAWSADGRFLYFCSAPALSAFTTPDSAVEYDRIQYDLMRVAYDAETGSWGELETVVSAAETGSSVLMPRPSPDGNYLLLCKAKYGNFPVFRPDCDLVLMDLRTGSFRKTDINSERADTFHSWSRNGRWFVFASKRMDEIGRASCRERV